jgi:hypothetical protein
VEGTVEGLRTIMWVRIKRNKTKGGTHEEDEENERSGRRRQRTKRKRRGWRTRICLWLRCFAKHPQRPALQKMAKRLGSPTGRAWKLPLSTLALSPGAANCAPSTPAIRGGEASPGASRSPETPAGSDETSAEKQARRETRRRVMESARKAKVDKAEQRNLDERKRAREAKAEAFLKDVRLGRNPFPDCDEDEASSDSTWSNSESETSWASETGALWGFEKRADGLWVALESRPPYYHDPDDA